MNNNILWGIWIGALFVTLIILFIRHIINYRNVGKV